MSLKIMGAVLITVGCGAVGCLIASSYRHQTKTLRQLLIALEIISCELQYRQTALPELCFITAQSCNGIIKKVFAELEYELKEGISSNVEKCMMIALEKSDNIQKYTKDAFVLLGQSLGRFDLDGQLKGIDMVKNEVNRLLRSQTDHQDTRIRCYQTLSICAGAAVAILFI